jgi:predicted CoA-binding protein
MTEQEQIREFLAAGPFAVVGASRERAKYGNKVLRAYLQHGFKVYPVNPNAGQVEGLQCYPDLASLPEPVRGVSIITPPEVSESIVQQAVALGIQNVWLQPGAENEVAVQLGADAEINLIAGGPCILVALRYRES